MAGILLGASLLGTAGAIPPPKRRLPATLVQMGGGLALLDRVEEAPRRQVAPRERTAP